MRMFTILATEVRRKESKVRVRRVKIPGGELNVVGSRGLGSSQENLIENFVLKFEHRTSTLPYVAGSLDGVQHVLVEVAEVLHR
jgi:hypothetical protein